jgi:putative ABC transport system ATP-binding protein
VTTLLQASGLGYSAGGRRVFAGVDLAVEPGQRLAVIGPSGSGKSSLLALLAGLAQPSEGEVRFDGQVVSGISGPAQGVAMVLQGYGLVSLLTAAENVEVALRATGCSRAQAAAGATAALAEVGMAAHADQLVEELSGGQQQRTAVARALALRPRLLIADEPTAELDPASRALTLARLLEVTERGAGLVLATHDPDVAARCDGVVDMRSGRAPGR